MRANSRSAPPAGHCGSEAPGALVLLRRAPPDRHHNSPKYGAAGCPQVGAGQGLAPVKSTSAIERRWRSLWRQVDVLQRAWGQLRRSCRTLPGRIVRALARAGSSPTAIARQHCLWKDDSIARSFLMGGGKRAADAFRRIGHCIGQAGLAMPAGDGADIAGSGLSGPALAFETPSNEPFWVTCSFRSAASPFHNGAAAAGGQPMYCSAILFPGDGYDTTPEPVSISTVPAVPTS